MALDVAPPEPPHLSNRGVPNEFEAVETVDNAAGLRREELESILRDGAWQEAFNEWAEYTDLSEAEFRTLDDLGLFGALDFYWDPEDGSLRFDSPLSDGAAEFEGLASLDRSLRDVAETELRDLGRTVVEMLEDAYTGEPAAWDDWSAATFRGATDTDAESEEL
jgi:hypothetical protein